MLKNLGEIADAYEALKDMSIVKATPKVAIVIKKNMQLIQHEYDVFMEKRQKLFSDLGIEKDNQINITPENMPEFQERIGELSSEEVEVETLLIKIDLLGDNFEISGQDLLALDWIIVE